MNARLICLTQTDFDRYIRACNELDRQYELLDALGADRP